MALIGDPAVLDHLSVRKAFENNILLDAMDYDGNSLLQADTRRNPLAEPPSPFDASNARFIAEDGDLFAIDEPAQPERTMTQAQRAELEARQKQGKARKGGQKPISDQDGGLFSSERDQGTLFRRGSSATPTSTVEAVTAELKKRMKAMGLDEKVRMRVIENMTAQTGAQGRFIPFSRAIQVALDAQDDHSFVLDHEAIHALREMGVFSKTDWALMVARAKKQPGLWRSVNRRYKDQNNAIREEEAVADLFAMYQRGDLEPKGALGKALDRIGKVLTAIKAAFGASGISDARTFRDVFAEIADGTAATREGMYPGYNAANLGLPRDMVAHHGTPHEWADDRADISKIGTGEGAQAYGWGLYFAGKREVAEHYRKALGHKRLINIARETYDEYYDASEAAEELLDNPDLTAADRELIEALSEDDWFGFEYPHQAISAAFRDIDNFDPSDRTRAAVKAQGRLYTVDIPEDGEYLLWDKPLSEQPEKVREAFDQLE